MAAAKKTNLPKTVYICTPTTVDMEGDYLPATLDIESYGFCSDEVWGEYQLVRKVRPRSTFHLEEA